MAPEVELNRFFKGDFDDDPAAALQALLRAILIRSQFQPTVRHVIGWRGLKQAVAEVECWTAKVEGSAGVFGLFYLDLEPTPGWITARFGLCYFPDPQEPLAERIALQAAAVAQREDYHPRIRDFLQHPDLTSLFGIGTILLSIRSDRRALALAMQAQSAQRILARDGVRLPKDGVMVDLVLPGGVDQDFPAFETALRFFEVLAASATLNLEQAPSCLIESRYSATQKVYDSAGRCVMEPAPDLWSGLVLVGYGAGEFNPLSLALAPAGATRLDGLSADRPETAVRGYGEKLWWRAHRLKDSKSIDKKSLGVDERPPLIVLTGFLGSGKTSFLKRFIEYQTQRSRFVAVIQNEIGEIGLDGKLLDYTVTEVDEGCVCCSLAGSLRRAVQGILAAFSPDTIILETTGVANPHNLLDELQALEELVRFDCTLTVVDALNAEKTLAEHPIAAEQIRAADLLMLNKKDLVTPDQLACVMERLQELNPRAPKFLTRDGDLNPALVLEVEDRPHAPTSGRRHPSAHPTHLQDGLWSKSIRFSRPLEHDAFLQTVAGFSPAVFRAKGIVDFTGSPHPMLFQYVNGRQELSVFSGPPLTERFLTVIGKGGDPGREIMAIRLLISEGR
ncbi:MAG: GTP-binding protein [Desulfobacterales bacterium]